MQLKGCSQKLNLKDLILAEGSRLENKKCDIFSSRLAEFNKLLRGDAYWPSQVLIPGTLMAVQNFLVLKIEDGGRPPFENR